MVGNFERKSRDIKRSLVRRARLRKAYFKLVKDEKPQLPPRNLSEDEIDLSEESIDSEDEADKLAAPKKLSQKKPHKSESDAPRLTKKQLAKQKRQEAYHQHKEREAARAKAEMRRLHKKGTVQKRTSRGQPKLGSRVGMLLEKLKQDEAQH